ncbi:uncharacterized protein LOC110711846 [Chenopodium quinoa]|uniref:Senescence regulator n=1 Tax=Chenopodium quinoa TaxID=63459 RepID=A0A803M7U7_CHEQI|nr:uncharacterized protein LOC110711846 [Chenopodium quinoa]
MASTKSYMMARRASNYRFLSNDPIQPSPIKTTTELEFEESDVWGGSTRSDPPESPTSWRKSRRPIAAPTPTRSQSKCVVGGDAVSLPVNIPDWSKILREEYKADKWSFGGEFESNGGGCGGDDGGDEWVPPHEYLARTRIASCSVHEGVGRTLKGRDLHKVRNAIWEKTGFQD